MDTKTRLPEVHTVRIYTFKTESEAAFYELNEIVRQQPEWNVRGKSGGVSDFEIQPVNVATIIPKTTKLRVTVDVSRRMHRGVDSGQGLPKGVYKSDNGKFIARCRDMVEGKSVRLYLGSFDLPEDAAEAYEKQKSANITKELAKAGT